MKKQITLIDCQVLQCKTWNRGMGKYSLAFLTELFARHEYLIENDFKLIFNKKLPIPDEVKSLIEDRGLIDSVIHIDLALPREPREKYSVDHTRLENKNILDNFITENFNKKLPNFLILSLYLDESTSVFPDNTKQKLIIYYDSIPYLYYERYNAFKGFFENFYLPHTKTLYEADKIFTISKTVANDLRIYFGISESKIFNINGASIKRNTSNMSNPLVGKVTKNSYVLMPTGEEIRKNNYRAVEAFELLSSRNESDLKLVITSTFNQDTKDKLFQISRNIIFTDNVNEDEISWLFQNAKFLLFPTEYEGLGLPILEAVDMGIPIACSDISVFREISPNSFSFFNPLDIEDMANKISQLDKSISEGKYQNHGYNLIKYTYQWSNTVDSFMSGLGVDNDPIKITKLRVAILCPDPTGFSAIGKVLTESHAAYSEYFDITYYFDKGPNHRSIRPNLLAHISKCEDILNFKNEDVNKFDSIIYHIGNSEYHINIINIALAIKGIVVLHDTFLDGVFLNMVENGNITPKRYELEKRLDNIIDDNHNTEITLSNCITSIINNQHAVIVHSEYAHDATLSKIINRNINVKKINLPVATPKFRNIIIPTKDYIQLSFAGIIAKIKGIEIIEELSMLESLSNTHINIFGYSSNDSDLISALKKRPNINLFTNLNDFGFQNLLSTTDILINVRLENRGETSLTTLEAMRFGVYVVVRNSGWFSEIPDELVAKIDDIYKIEKTILDSMHLAHADTKLRDKIIDYIELEHRHDKYASEAYNLIRDIIKK